MCPFLLHPTLSQVRLYGSKAFLCGVSLYFDSLNEASGGRRLIALRSVVLAGPGAHFPLALSNPALPAPLGMFVLCASSLISCINAIPALGAVFASGLLEAFLFEGSCGTLGVFLPEGFCSSVTAGSRFALSFSLNLWSAALRFFPEPWALIEALLPLVKSRRWALVSSVVSSSPLPLGADNINYCT